MSDPAAESFATLPAAVAPRQGWIATLCGPRMLRWWVLALALHFVIYPEVSFLDGNMQNSVVALSAAWVEDNRFQIDGMQNTTPDQAFRNGHFYSGMAPGVSALGVPFYALARALMPLAPEPLGLWFEHKKNTADAIPYTIFQTSRYRRLMMTNALLTILFGFFGAGMAFGSIQALARALGDSRRQATLAAGVFVFGTVMLFYLSAYYTQSVALILLLGAMTLMLARPASPTHPASRGRLLIAGLLAVSAGCCDYPYFLYAAIALAGGCLAEPGLRAIVRRTVWLALGGLPPFLALLAYHTVCFGSPTATAYQFRIATASYGHQHGLSGVALPSLARLRDLLISPGEGILPLMPVLVLAVPGAWMLARRCWGTSGRFSSIHGQSPTRLHQAWRGRVLFTTLAVMIVASVFHFCGIPWPSNMASYGPRFFLAALPGLAIFCLPRGAADWGRRLWTGLFVLLLAVTITIGVLHNVTSVDWWFLPGPPPPPAQTLLFPISIPFSLAGGLLTWCLWQALPVGVLALGVAWNRRRGDGHQAA